MSDTQLGQLITGAGERDAVHVALAPVTANERLKPGQHVGFVRGHNTELVGVSSNPVGIVDPFLEHSVERGQRFYLVLYPNTVTGMKHHWEHPAFGLPSVNESEAWLQELADEIGIDYNTLLAGIGDGSVYTGDREMYGIRDDADIRTHYNIVTGQHITHDIHFRCAC